MADNSSDQPKSVEINGTTYPPLADGQYDAIVLGTGLTECILSGLLSKKGMKVLQVDRNDYYGGEAASLSMKNLFKKFCGAEPSEESMKSLGSDRDYNVDLIPKFIMANGKLVKILIHTGVTRYLEFKCVDGSYVFKQKGGVHKVPANEVEALKTGLMGFFQKRKFRNFLHYIAGYDEANPSTWDGLDLRRVPMQAVYDKFGLDHNSQDFAGHALGLRTDDDYKRKPALETVLAIKLYAMSLERYGKSPYIYPMYGLGGLPEAFSRLCAIHGGVFMLATKVEGVLYNDKGQAVGVTATRDGELQAASAPIVVGDPSYFPREKLKQTGRVARSICILDHEIPHLKGVQSAQIILPQNQLQRHHDVYVSFTSSEHCVAPRGKYVAIVSTTVETDNPERELDAGVALLGPALQRFDNVLETFEPAADGREDRCFISKSYDATSHFESTSNDVLDLYERITGEKFNLDISAEIPEE